MDMADRSYPLSASQAETLRTVQWLASCWSGLALRRKEYWPAGFNLWFSGACALLCPTLAVQSFTRLRRHQRAIGTGSGNASL